MRNSMTNRTFRLVVSVQLVIIFSMLVLITAGEQILGYLADTPPQNVAVYEIQK